MDTLRPQCASAFKLSGLKLQPDAMTLLTRFLASIQLENDRNKCLNDIVSIVTKQSLSSTLISLEILDKCIKEFSNENDESLDTFTVINAVDFPRLEYASEKKRLFCSQKVLTNLLGTIDDRISLLRNRFIIVQQRIARHELFVPSAINKTARFNLRAVENLQSSPESSLESCVCLAMLTQLKENKYYLEDLTGHAEIDLSQANFQTGLFVENCIVLAEGSFSDGVFKAQAIGLPPLESAEKTREFFGNLNFFGGPSKTAVAKRPDLFRIEKQHPSAAIAFLSDVWLDSQVVLEKLRQLFMGFVDHPPVCFVFCGKFLSKYDCSGNIDLLKDSFKNLVDLLQEFPSIVQQSQFVFVPSLQDPLLTSVYPKPPLPSNILTPILAKIPNYHLASNPCRLQYCSQEIVIFREDIIEKMCRNCVRVPSDVSKLHEHFVRTILSQNHLAPLPLNVLPVFWPLDNAMRLYPLPDLIVCCDKYSQYSEKSHDCTVTNPGTFSNNKFVFQLYYPSSRQIDDSAVPED